MLTIKDATLLQPSALSLAFLQRAHRLLIGGDWVAGNGRSIIVENPARETLLTEIRAASADQLDEAVRAARQALRGEWRRMSSSNRALLLQRFADMLEARSDLVAEVMTLDNGSPLNSSKMVVRHLAVELFRYYAGWATKLSGESFTPNIGARPNQDFMVATLREPVGVVGAIVPWNAPPGMIALKMAPALAAGCTLVVKTAEAAPLVGELFAEIWQDIGGPPGVFNLIHGHGEDIGAAMAAHPGIDKIAFTGSTDVGRKIITAASGNLKRVTLELGGKSPVVIFPDADLTAAIPAASMACYLSTGQACIAGSRLFVHEDVHDEVVGGLARHASALPIGDGMLPDTVLGPLISAHQKQRVQRFITVGRNEGATAVLAGEDPGGPGHFLKPALFIGVQAGMQIEQQEIFGPVLCVLRFREEEELLAAINGTSYALSGSLWTTNIQRALRVARQIDSGQVGINIHGAMSAETPFGGNRQSGWGREFGREGLDPYLKTKAISMNLGNKL